MTDAATSTTTTPSELRQTPLAAAHNALGARMVPFAGYEMPVQYAPGVLKEHVWTRDNAGLFDVSHMGQALLIARDGRYDTAALALEALVPADILGLKPGQQRYTQLVNDQGGILDDLMVARSADPEAEGRLFIVWNASRKDFDAGHVQSNLPEGVALEVLDDLALVALQGPAASEVLAQYAPATADLAFMTTGQFDIGGAKCMVSRSGYTGEDGFEISCPAQQAAALWQLLSSDERVAPIGLGARDNLRLEAGLPLYGNDIDETTSPVEAGLVWSIGKARRPGGARAGGFPGAQVIAAQLESGVERKRVGLKPEGRAPVRGGAPLFASPDAQEAVGAVTSGGFGPTAGAPVAMGYLPIELAAPGTRVFAEVRGQRLPVIVCGMPFVPHRYKR